MSADLIEDLLVALEPYDVALSGFTNIRSWLRAQGPVAYLDVRRDFERTLSTYLESRTRTLRDTHGHDYADQRLAGLVGLHASLIVAGKLTGDPTTDHVLIYAAHISALTSYGDAPWHNVSKLVLAAQMNTIEKELAKRS